ncbi:alpha/beta fold hydrolase [Bradyrhizobium sp.]|uniref:alpha/beta fold hydrolase n=1 Tax=Bradyrhizobium sp. TaxID=376 RepID=UPI0039E4C508
MPAPLPGRRVELADRRAGRLMLYGEAKASSGATATPPLLLVHSVNAAATAYEMKPLFEHYRSQRAVYALDLPGFGLSDRSNRKYTPRLMTDAIHAAVHDIQAAHGDGAIDIVALSLGCEFAARAATEAPNAFRSIALISPTGFDRRSARAATHSGGNGTRAMPWLHGLLSVPLWKRGFFSALTSRASIRFFLQKTWGAKQIDEGLLEYDYITTHQPGAENAPYYFVSGYLFSTDAMKLYQNLSMPVWMSHGVRGDFVDYAQKVQIKRLPNWSVSVLQTGAMPHFEKPVEFIAQFETFLKGATPE